MQDQQKNETYSKLLNRRKLGVQPDKESDTGVIIAALKALQEKLKELEDERNAAKILITQLSGGGGDHQVNRRTKEPAPPTQTKPYGSNVDIDSIQFHCVKIENQLMKILALTRETVTVNQLPIDSNSKLAKVKCEPKVVPQKHYKPDYRALPFVPPGSASTFSLPATIQTLISNLKTQHNQLCLASQVGASVKSIVLSSENYLKELVETLHSSAKYMNTECIRIARQTNGDLTKNGSLVMVLTQIDELAKLTDQICELQNKIIFLKKQVHKFPVLDIPAPRESSVKNSKTRTLAVEAKPKTVQPPFKPRNHGNKVCKTVNRHPFHHPPTKKPLVKSQSNVKVTHPNVETLRYVKLLQVSLRRNGYKLKMTED